MGRVTTAPKTLAAPVVLYLLLGVLFAVEAQPQQLWACPAPREPHGEILHDKRFSPECEATVTAGDRAKHFAAATVFGIPAAIIKGANGD